MSVIAVDPGNEMSAFAVVDADTCYPKWVGKLPNAELRDALANLADEYRDGGTFVIEMVASYGMAVGATVFDTCVWVGRFAETIDMNGGVAELVYRADVKLHHCQSRRAKDANITQALIDRFAKGQPNRGKGTKAAPGWFHGFAADVWQAYALAVYVADTQRARVAS